MFTQDPNCTTKGQTCIFPFTYKGVEYDECATNAAGRGWCATKVDGNLKYVSGNWGYCPHECAVANPSVRNKVFVLITVTLSGHGGKVTPGGSPKKNTDGKTGG